MLLLLSAMATEPLIGVKRGAECVSLLLPVHSLSTAKTPAVPPRGHIWKLGTLRYLSIVKNLSFDTRIIKIGPDNEILW